MKYIKFHKSTASELCKEVAKRRGWVLDERHFTELIDEDAFIVSLKHSIFSVADGVTLAVAPGNEYPIPSGAKAVAEIFCNESVKIAEQIYSEIDSGKLPDIFRLANKEVQKYNNRHDRTSEKINYWDNDYYCATAAMAIIKEKKLFWGNICDSGVAVFDKTGKEKFITDEGWDIFNKNIPSNWEQLSLYEKSVIKNRDLRNKIIDCNRAGYGVINGEENAIMYLDHGCFDLQEGDIVFIFTDGYFPYFKSKDFIECFLSWSDDLKLQIEKQTSTVYSHYSQMYEFNTEGSLIAVKIE